MSELLSGWDSLEIRDDDGTLLGFVRSHPDFPYRARDFEECLIGEYETSELAEAAVRKHVNV